MGSHGIVMISKLAATAAYSIAAPCNVHPTPSLQVVHVDADSDSSTEPGLIFLTPGPGFGSGRHPTTRMCLEFLESCLKRFTYPKILDAGTGNGILAIAAARLGAAHVIGVDTHLAAVQTARRNLQVNCVADQVSILHRDIARISEKFNLIIANLCPEHLMELVDVLEKHLNAGGHMILSGLKGFDKARALRRLVIEGNLKLLDERWEEGWSALLMEKGL